MARRMAVVDERGEPLLLPELVTPLVHNAVTYTPAGGHVTVSAGRVEGGARRRAAGSGLGLAIVKEICARHGAEVRLADPPPGGHGLCVDVRFVARMGG
ncbi:MAG: hypothetical protein U5L05_16310 [Rubrivivax sp.]|nr:hypothetical protein [Rubrivivax sp.]